MFAVNRYPHLSHSRAAAKKGRAKNEKRGTKKKPGARPYIYIYRTSSLILSVTYISGIGIVQRARAGTSTAEGRSRTKRRQDGGKGSRERWNGECEARAEGGYAGERGKTLFPLKGGRHFSPRARWLSCVFCSGVVAA